MFLKSDRGSVVVEFALILPVILILLFGIIECGSFYYAKHQTIYACREGTRLLTMTSTQNNISEIEIENLIKNALVNYPHLYILNIVGYNAPTGALVYVEILSNYPFIVLNKLIPILPTTLSTSSKTVMRHE